jgi:Fe-S oxidoreductase/electron transfer flavoprotein alpha/beta subunit
METRKLFWALSAREVLLFYILGYSAIAVFAFGIYWHIKKYRQASPGTVPEGQWRRGLWRMLTDVFTHRTLVRRDRFAGIAHAGIFFGFCIAFLGTTIIFVDNDIIQPLLGFSFWKGKFYLAFELVLDVGGLALLIGCIAMSVRRWLIRPAKLGYVRRYAGEAELSPRARSWMWEDRAFLWALLMILATGFLSEGLRLYMDRPPWAWWSPVGNMVALLFAQCQMSMQTAGYLRYQNWWFHGVVALLFIAAIPWYKAKHIIAVLASLALRDSLPLSRLPREAEGIEKPGIATLSDLTLKDMVDLDACTKCGRCHDVCPARTSGLPLSPRDLILDLRVANKDAKSGATLVETLLRSETLWSCLTCGACQDVCPVGIEHPSKIVRMRRHLVDEGKIEPALQRVFDAVADTGNSFGEPARSRPAWTHALEFEVKDIRETSAEYLWFVGDYASFDPRNQQVSRTVARLLKAAKLDFALLHEGERTAGNDIRRAGEEGLFEMLVEHNRTQISNAKPFQRIITTDPHSYNTLRNEYPEFGHVAQIDHYSTILAELLRAGRLKVKKPLGKRVTFHDPCHLGRLNGGYDAPRDVLRLIGCEIVEMPRNRANSFCCGAGGGRIWMVDKSKEKPSASRMHEAAALPGGVAKFVTCCPKDLNMYEDANKTSGHIGSFSVDDLAELVAEAIELDQLTLEDVPPLVEQIVQIVSQRIVETVTQRLDAALALRPVTPPAWSSLASEPSPREAAFSAIATPVPPSDEVVERVSEQEPQRATVEIPPTVAAAGDAGNAPQNGGSGGASLRTMTWDHTSPVTPAALPSYDRPEKTGRRFLVPIKHVASLSDEFELDENQQQIKPTHFDYSLNEWDEAALEKAMLLSEAIGSCEVVVVTVGDEGADASLRKALAKGAHRAIRVWHESLQDADPITIARGLAGVAKLEEPDMILCGVQSSDYGHGSTGTALAQMLNIPHAAVVVDCRWDGGATLTLTREIEGGIRHQFILPMPALITVQTGTHQPRYATMKMVKQAKTKPLSVVDGASINDGYGGYVVRRMYTPEFGKAEMLSGGAAEVAAFIEKAVRKRRGA